MVYVQFHVHMFKTKAMVMGQRYPMNCLMQHYETGVIFHILYLHVGSFIHTILKLGKVPGNLVDLCSNAGSRNHLSFPMGH